MLAFIFCNSMTLVGIAAPSVLSSESEGSNRDNVNFMYKACKLNSNFITLDSQAVATLNNTFKIGFVESPPYKICIEIDNTCWPEEQRWAAFGYGLSLWFVVNSCKLTFGTAETRNALI